MNSFDVPDATDWASTTLSGFVAVESPMRCQVCKEFIKTPMITSCGHTFCSECIRRSLSHNGLCPACRTPDQELKLRANKSMEEVVEAFQRAREAALEVARVKSIEEISPKRKRPQIESRETSSEPNKKTRMSRRISSRATPQSTVDGDVNVDLVAGSDDEYVPDDGLVQCIMCDARMKEAAVSKHLDDIHFNPAPKQSSTMSSFATQSPAPRQSSSRLQTEFHPKPLPTISYNLLKDKALRDKLHSLGIPAHGTRPLMERRHREWMTLWNANCDATTPKSKRELLKQLDEWERTQAHPTVHRGPKGSQIANKEFDGGQWATQHSEEFNSLVEKARKQIRERREKEKEAAAGETTKEKESPSGTAETQRNDFAATRMSQNIYLDENMTEHVQSGKVSAEPQSINRVSADLSSIPKDQGAELDQWWTKDMMADATAPAGSQSQNLAYSEAPGARQPPYQQPPGRQWNDNHITVQGHDEACAKSSTHYNSSNNIDPALGGPSAFDFNAYAPSSAQAPPPPSSQPNYQQQRHQQALPQPLQQAPPSQSPYQNISPSPQQNHWSPHLIGNLQNPNSPNSDSRIQRMLKHGDVRHRDGAQVTAHQRLEILQRPYKRTGSDGS